MTLKTIGCALLLFPLWGSHGEISRAGADPPVAPDAATEPSDKNSQPAAVARRVFEGSPFWWKHRATVEVPAHDFGILGGIKRVVSEVMHFFGRILDRLLRFLS